MLDLKALLAEEKNLGKKPYIVPGGASNKIGALGYVSCAQEIMQQMFSMPSVCRP